LIGGIGGMNQRWIPAVVILLMVALAASCGVQPRPAEDNRERVTITFLHMWPESNSGQQNRIVNRIVRDYEKLNPDVDIKVEVLDNESYKERLKILSASNRLPDVGVTWAAGFLEPYVIGKRFAELDDLMEEGLEWEFAPGTTEAYVVGGRLYALPLEFNIVPVFYNKRIFAENGLKVPNSYESFKQTIASLQEAGVVPIALGNRERWPGSLWFMYLADRIAGPNAIRDAINRTSRFNVPGMKEAAREIQELVDMRAFNRGFSGMSTDDAKTEFVNGRAAMYMVGTWELPNLIMDPRVPQDFKENLGYFKFPLVDENKSSIDSWVGGPGVGLFVAEDSPHKQEAKAFVRFFLQKWGEVSVTDAGIIPATKVDTADLDLPQIYIDILRELQSAANMTLYADVAMKPGAAETHLSLIQSLYGKVVTPEQFVNEHEAALEKRE
jgi:raffinose/stachyose/melibiose transport system substrate-binding protein